MIQETQRPCVLGVGAVLAMWLGACSQGHAVETGFGAEGLNDEQPGDAGVDDGRAFDDEGSAGSPAPDPFGDLTAFCGQGFDDALPAGTCDDAVEDPEADDMLAVGGGLAAFCGQGFDDQLPPGTCDAEDGAADAPVGEDAADPAMALNDALCGSPLEGLLPAGTCDAGGAEMEGAALPGAADLCGTPLEGLLPEGTCVATDALCGTPLEGLLPAGSCGLGLGGGADAPPAGQDALCGTPLEGLLPAGSCEATPEPPPEEAVGQGALCGTPLEAFLPAGTCDAMAEGGDGDGDGDGGNAQQQALCGTPLAQFLPAGTCD